VQQENDKKKRERMRRVINCVKEYFKNHTKNNLKRVNLDVGYHNSLGVGRH
jgi:hypothetical protein